MCSLQVFTITSSCSILSAAYSSLGKHTYSGRSNNDCQAISALAPSSRRILHEIWCVVQPSHLMLGSPETKEDQMDAWGNTRWLAWCSMAAGACKHVPT